MERLAGAGQVAGLAQLFRDRAEGVGLLAFLDEADDVLIMLENR